MIQFINGKTGLSVTLNPEDVGVVVYTITAPAEGWEDGSLVWGGTTYTRKCAVAASQASATPKAVSMSFAGGDYDAYCQVSLIDTKNGSVDLWATADPTAECQIRIMEVRPSEQN